MPSNVASFLSSCWDFIDKRDIDKHAICWSVFYVTIKLLIWTCHFAATSPRPGMEVAAIIGAVWGPWSLVQGGVINWYFNTKTGQ